jgi:hypothetical protein
MMTGTPDTNCNSGNVGSAPANRTIVSKRAPVSTLELHPVVKCSAVVDERGGANRQNL